VSTATAFVAAARAMLGTPFKHQGRLPGVGLDCAGLVVCALREAGIEVRDVKGYARIPSKGLFVAMVREHCDEIAFSDLAAGDLCLFRFRSEPQHLAIYDAGRILHSHSAVGRAVEHDLDVTWRGRLTGCYRLKGGG